MAIDHSTSAIPKPTRKRKKNRVRSKRTKQRRSVVARLDALARAEVMERDGSSCIAQGIAGIRCGEGVQWAHVLSRTHKCLRWEADNAMSLCGGHHLWWHHEPAMAVDWFIRTYRERWERIKAVLLVNPKVNPKELLESRLGPAEKEHT